VRLAPLYDVVTTTAYLQQDVPALSLGGTKKWWPRKVLEKFAVAHLALPVGRVGQILETVAEAVTGTRGMISEYVAEHPEFREVGGQILTAWDVGVSGLTGES
jgi:serine/threonine-protein kinase HipA